MGVHDWSHVSAGVFFDFHLAWVAFLRNALNQGILPAAYFAQVEHAIGEQKHVAIRHSSTDRIVAIIEIISPGNKNSEAHFEKFMAKVKQALLDGIHLLIIDLFPPTPRDPNGIHAKIWEYVSGEEFSPPGDKPLSLASYDARALTRAYVEPLAVGDALIDMPLFLWAKWYVPVPLEKTYQAAWDGMPAKYRRILANEGPTA